MKCCCLSCGPGVSGGPLCGEKFDGDSEDVRSRKTPISLRKP